MKLVIADPGTCLYVLRSGEEVATSTPAFYKIGVSKQVNERVTSINRELAKKKLPLADVVDVWNAEEVHWQAETVEQTTLAYLAEYAATKYPGNEWVYCPLQQILDEIEDAIIDAQLLATQRAERHMRFLLNKCRIAGDEKATKGALLDALFGPEEQTT